MKRMLLPITKPDYGRFIKDLKARVTEARISAARHVNRDLILLYWDLGQAIDEKQQVLGWGEAVIDQISADLRAAFPSASGFSPRNLRDMKRFYLAYSDETIWPQAVAKLRQHIKWPQVVAKSSGVEITNFMKQLVAEIPWGHHRFLLDEFSDSTARLGWSRNILLKQIKAGTYERAVTEKNTCNIDFPLPEHFAEQTDEMLRSSYNVFRRSRDSKARCLAWYQSRKGWSGSESFSKELLPPQHRTDSRGGERKSQEMLRLHQLLAMEGVAFRTRKDRKLALKSDAHTYDKPGRCRILVKLIDPSQALDVEVPLS